MTYNCLDELLTTELFIGKGKMRTVYAHPFDKQLVIKVAKKVLIQTSVNGTTGS